jgi:hypothetical protein
VIEPDDFQVTDDGVPRNGESWGGIIRVDDPDEEPEEDQNADEHIYLDGDLKGLDYELDVHEFGHIQDSQAAEVQDRDTESNKSGAEDANEEEIGYEDAFEAPDSSGSEHTVAGDDPAQNSTASATDEVHDEINYDEEDDDQLDLAPFPETQVTTETLVINGSTGKRARTETEDIVDRGSKGR